MITTQWLENLVKRNISNYEERVRAEGLDQGRDQVLDLLDEDTRKDIERKLQNNDHPQSGD